MESHLPPGWQMFRNSNGKIVYLNTETREFQDTLPMEALPPGWEMFKNSNGKIVYVNTETREFKDTPPVALGQPPSAPPVDPITERVKTHYYPHIFEFSRIPPKDIIAMLHHPQPPPALTPDEEDLIINNYVGTSIDVSMRTTVCGKDADILSCAKKLFKMNATASQLQYSFKLPPQPADINCNVPFRWSIDNQTHKPLDTNPTVVLANRLIPLNPNTVRWLCSTDVNPIPSMGTVNENMFVLDFFNAKDSFRKFGQPIIQLAIERRKHDSDPQNIEYARKAALQAEEQQTKRDEEAKRKAEQQRRLDPRQQAEKAKRQSDIKAEFIDHMTRLGGLKGRRKQSRRKQSRRKQSRRKQSRRRS